MPERKAAGWGGKRKGAGRKPENIDPNEVRGTRAKKVKSAPVFDRNVLAAMIPDLIKLSEKYAKERPRTNELNPFRFAEHPKSATPSRSLQMAQDSALVANNEFASGAWLAGGIINGIGAEGLMFLGYPYLAELAQRPEYRIISETIADDATRKWIDFDVTGDEDEQRRRTDRDPIGEAERRSDPDERAKRVGAAGKTDKVKALKDDQERLEVRDKFYALARDDGFFGRSHLYLDVGVDFDKGKEELKVPIGSGRDATSKGKIAKGSFKAVRTIEAVWTYPMMYNAINPLRPDWYNPQIWYVMGQQIDGSRLLTFVGHPVPDLLKPAYSFGGLSLSQMAKPYVDIWLTTRQSVANLIHSFSVMVLMTDMATILQPGEAGALLARAALFNALRDNQGLMVVNKDSEDFKNVQASLAGLHELQAQAQEHMASVSRIPLVKLTGISPSGLNASSDGEIRAYYDTISAYQNRFYRPGLTKVINFEQLSLWGEIDPEITFQFKPLWEMSEKEKADLQKANAERDQIYVDMGALSNGEVRKIVADDPELPYTALDPDDVPDLRQEEEQGLEPEGGRPDPELVEQGEKDEDAGVNRLFVSKAKPSSI